MQYGRKIGEGNTATIHEWEPGTVIKLFNPGYSKAAIEREFRNARAINDLDFAKPRAYELVCFAEQAGIIYDRVEGESLLEWVLRTGDVRGCAKYMAKLHRTIVTNSVGDVPDYKDFLQANVIKATASSVEEQAEVLKQLESLNDGDALCHGDFHPGNILLANDQTTAIDFMNMCRGDYLYDVARTVFLVEYTPVPAMAVDRETLLGLKKTLADLYLIEMDVTRKMIQDYLSVIIIARRGECPEEDRWP